MATYAATLRWVARAADRAAGDQLQAPIRGLDYLRSQGCGLLELDTLQQYARNAIAILRELSLDAERLRARLVARAAHRAGVDRNVPTRELIPDPAVQEQNGYSHGAP